MHIAEKEHNAVVGASRASTWLDEQHNLGNHEANSKASPPPPADMWKDGGDSCVWKPASITADELKSQGQRLKRQKYAFWALYICINAAFIASYQATPDPYIHDNIVRLNAYFDIIQILGIVYYGIRHRIAPPPAAPVPEAGPESIALLLTCYDETAADITSSLDSLVAQTRLDGHKRALLVVCDGKKTRGAGARKTTAEILRDDVFAQDGGQPAPVTTVRSAYMGWRRHAVDVDIFTGTYAGSLPFCCIVKHENQSKRDSLLMVRSLLHKHNTLRRGGDDKTGIFRPEALHTLSTWLARDGGIETCDYIVGVDADTELHHECVHHLVDEARRSGAAGVCGNLEVNHQKGPGRLLGRVPGFWALLTNAQFFTGQLVNRRFQALATGRIACLTGCCQLLRVGALNGGDREVLAGPFGRYPGPRDGLWRQLLGKVGEDRHHTCLFITTRPEARTSMAVRAVAYTKVPESLVPFLNQRRRWTQSRLANEIILLMGRHTHPFERAHTVVRIIQWTFFFSIRICALLAFSPQLGSPGSSKSRGLRSMILFITPMAFYLCMIISRPIPWLSRMYLALGMVLSVVFGHIVFGISTLYTLFYLDYLGWRETLDGTGLAFSATSPCPAEKSNREEKDAKQL